MRKPAYWAHYLDEDLNFKRWYDNLARGSRLTARDRARVLIRFTRAHGMDPKDLVDLGKRDRSKVEDLLLDHITKLQNEGKAPGYLENYLKSVKSWMLFNDIQLIRKIKVGNRNSRPTLVNEIVPTRDQLRQVINQATLRGRVCIALMAFSGLRPDSICDDEGKDGLTVGDLPELRIQGGSVFFEKIPTRIVIWSENSKTHAIPNVPR